MSGKQKLPATDRISLAEARATWLLELWRPKCTRNNPQKGRTAHTKRTNNNTPADPKLTEGEVLMLHLPWPPSINHLYEPSAGGGKHIGKTGKAYIRRVAELVMVNRLVGMVGSALIDVVMVLHEPDNGHVHDSDNYRKCLFDSLTKAGFWSDDQQIKLDLTVMGEPVKHGSVELSIRLHKPQAAFDAAKLMEMI